MFYSVFCSFLLLIKRCIFRLYNINIYIEQTISEYDSIIKKCEDIFAKKMKDYGSAWRILRISSLTDQIFIKAQRIRSIEDKGLQKVEEGVVPEFIGIVNYSIIGLIQLELGVSEQAEEMQYDQVMNLFEKHALEAKKLMLDKNHDIIINNVIVNYDEIIVNLYEYYGGIYKEHCKSLDPETDDMYQIYDKRHTCILTASRKILYR